MANNNEAAVAVKLTRLEQYVADHPNTTFECIAADLETTPGAVIRAYDRLEKKLKAAGVTADELFVLKRIDGSEPNGWYPLNGVAFARAIANLKDRGEIVYDNDKGGYIRVVKTYKTKSWLQWTPADVADAIADGVYRHGPFPGFQPLNQVPNPLIG